MNPMEIEDNIEGLNLMLGTDHDVVPVHLSQPPVRQFLTAEEHGKYWHDLAQERIAEVARLRSENDGLLDALEKFCQASQSPDPNDWEDALAHAEDILSNDKEQQSLSGSRPATNEGDKINEH